MPKWPKKDVKAKEVLKDLKLAGPFSVIWLAGVEGESHGKLLTGLVRAAYRTDSIIVDSGGSSGIESACAKNTVALLGVASEDSVAYPTKSSANDNPRTLVTPGHTHLITLGNKGDRMPYEDVLAFKMRLLRRLVTGRRAQRELLCVVAGDGPNCCSDIEMVRAMQTLGLGGCVLALEVTKLGRSICNFVRGSTSSVPQRLVEGIMKGRVFAFPKAGNADHLSSAAYAYLTVHIT